MLASQFLLLLVRRARRTDTIENNCAFKTMQAVSLRTKRVVLQHVLAGSV